MMMLPKLHSACWYGDLEKVKECANPGNINEVIEILKETDDDQWTVVEKEVLSPLICAIRQNHLTIVEFLCEHDASIYLLEPFRVACRQQHSAIVNYLLSSRLIFNNPAVSSNPAPPSSSLSLWYEQSASQWLEALPIGNGHLGAMIFGGYPQEIIQLNNDTLWAGCPHDYANKDAFTHLASICQMIRDEQWVDAQTVLTENFFGVPINQAPYQTAGNLLIDFFHQVPSTTIDQYQRVLDLGNAVASTTYSDSNGNQYRRTCFASYPDKCIVYRAQSSTANAINCMISFASPQKIQISTDKSNNLIIDGVGGDFAGMSGSIRFRLLVNVELDGECDVLDDRLVIFSSTTVTLRIVLATSYINYSNVNGDEVKLSDTLLHSSQLWTYQELFERHLDDYQSLFNRVQLNLGESAAMLQPTDRRIQNFAQNPKVDPQFVTLYFQFGRYLLISSSRSGSQAANLQGVWNDSMSPPWSSKYTININIEMNYWPAGPANLLECCQPLFDLIEDISHTGQSTAQLHYGTKREGSWVCHHNTDIWRGTAPVDHAVYGTWPTGGVWLCKSIVDYYAFTHDKEKLLRYYPVLRSAAQFFLETLVKSSEYLLTSPSMSPEVPHHVELDAVVCEGPTLDVLLLKDLFTSVIDISLLFDMDAPFRDEVRQALNQLPPLRIGQIGQLQEWFEDWDQVADIHNRHMSHLYCVFPGNSVTNEPSKYHDAALRSLDLRGILLPSTGWSLAWKSNIWARLHQSSTAFELLRMLLTPLHTAANLFDLIEGPPFQIDANFGATSAVCEMLLQSHKDRLELLPALPTDQWPTGFVRGLRARGNYEVNIWWVNGVFQRAEIIPLSNQTVCKVSCEEREVVLENLTSGYVYHLNDSLEPREKTIRV